MAPSFFPPMADECPFDFLTRGYGERLVLLKPRVPCQGLGNSTACLPSTLRVAHPLCH